ncbi:MAG: DUF835 domain-containing protein [Candidatus Methanofastidiosia archaeon]|jgi:hypothetical protein
MHLYIIPSLLSLVGNAILGLYLIVKNPNSKVTYAFSVLVLLLVGWAFSETMMRNQIDPEQAVFWGKILYLNAFFLPSAFIALSYLYTGGKAMVWVGLSYAVGGAFVPLLWTKGFLQEVKEIPPWGYDVVVGPLFSYFAVVYLLAISVGVIILLKYYRQNSPLEKRRLQFMLVGFLVSVFLIGMSNLLSRVQDLPLPRMGSMFTLVATVSFAYGMAKYKLLIVPTRERARTTMDARCGALCSMCKSYVEGLCVGCEQVDAKIRESCPIYQCSLQKGVLCEECPELLECPIYREFSEHCPVSIDFYGLAHRTSYVWEHSDPGVAFEIFLDYTARGAFGLLITRDYPKKVQEKYELLDVSCIWLSQVESAENAVDPTNLPRLTYMITQFIKQVPESFILLVGVEYLVVHNGFDRVLKFLHTLNDRVMTHNARFLVVVDPKTLDPREVSLLERELHPLKKENLFKSLG